MAAVPGTVAGTEERACTNTLTTGAQVLALAGAKKGDASRQPRRMSLPSTRVLNDSLSLVLKLFIKELQQATDQQFFNAVHGQFTTGFTAITPCIWLNTVCFVSAGRAVASVVF